MSVHNTHKLLLYSALWYLAADTTLNYRRRHHRTVTAGVKRIAARAQHINSQIATCHRLTAAPFYEIFIKSTFGWLHRHRLRVMPAARSSRFPTAPAVGNLLYELPKQMFSVLFPFLLTFFFLFFIKIYALSHKYLCICPVVVASLPCINAAPSPPIVQLGQFLPINRRAISRTSAMRLLLFLGLCCPGFNFALLFMGLRPAMAGAKCHGSVVGMAVGEVSRGVAYQ